MNFNIIFILVFASTVALNSKDSQVQQSPLSEVLDKLKEAVEQLKATVQKTTDSINAQNSSVSALAQTLSQENAKAQQSIKAAGGDSSLSQAEISDGVPIPGNLGK